MSYESYKLYSVCYILKNINIIIVLIYNQIKSRKMGACVCTEDRNV